MKPLRATAVAVVGVLAIATASNASAPTVTKTYRTYNSYDIAVTVDAGTVKGGPYARLTTSGGCVLTSVRGFRGRVTVTGAKCATPGVVHFITPDFPACDTPFAITVDGATVYTDVLGPACRPPTPSAVVTRSGDIVTFTNPATVAQSASYHFAVDALDGVTFTADGPLTATAHTGFAGTGPNSYVYYYYALSATVAAGATVTVVRAS